LEILGKVYGTKLSINGPRARNRHGTVLTAAAAPRFHISARITQELLKDVDKDERVKPFDVTEALIMTRELIQKEQDLVTRYEKGEHTVEVLNLLRKVCAEVSV
jgi:hypothetical protein